MSSLPVDRPARTHYTWFLLVSSVAAIVALLGVIKVLSMKHGWDAQIFCSGARTAGAGGNPYDVRELGLPLSWNYQPYLLPLFNTICQTPVNFGSTYPILYVVLLISGVAVWRPAPDLLFALILSLGGFCGFIWAIRTGNIAIPEFLLISIVIFLFHNRHWYVGGVILAILASVKLLTLAYLFLLLFIPETKDKRTGVVVVSLMTFALTFGISFALYPDLMKPFMEQALGLIPNQHNAWIETGRMTNLPLAFFLTDLLKLAGVNLPFQAAILIGSALAVAIVFMIFRRILSPAFIAGHFMDFFNLGLIAITLILPRLKPYSFLMVIPPLFHLLRSGGKGHQSVAMVLSTILPAVILLIQLNSIIVNRELDLMLGYAPTISLLATFALLVHSISLRPEYA